LILDRDWGAGRDAPVVARLKAAGAVITGKTTTSEFACGFPDPTKPFAIPRNPWDLDRSPAGSSAGTGNGIAAGLFLAGIGTDTGGSIRAPSSVNGITGLKPTFGLVPKSGCVPLGYSLDHIGPMARTARDCAAMLSIIAGYDPSDECCAAVAVDDYVSALDGSLSGVRVGVDREHHFPDDADPALRVTFEQAVTGLESLGATIVEVSLPYYDEMRAGLLATMLSEALAYHRDDLQARWHDYYSSTRVNLAFGALTAGTDYVQAQRVRRLTKHKLGQLFTTVDLVVTPTSPKPAPLIADMAGMIVTRLLKSSFTSYWNMMGQPALALPMGFNAAGLPLSLQIAGRPFEDALVLRAGDAYQSVTDWHLRLPAVAVSGLSAPRSSTTSFA
jgi:aspartyl-tRNA(Asn)/glutamyl-tRNA(Gln) amidotransferase subunit A